MGRLFFFFFTSYFFFPPPKAWGIRARYTGLIYETGMLNGLDFAAAGGSKGSCEGLEAFLTSSFMDLLFFFFSYWHLETMYSNISIFFFFTDIQKRHSWEAI